MSEKVGFLKTLRQVLWLILVSLVLAVAVNLLHPKRIPWVGDWANRVEAQAVAEGIPLVQLSDMIGFWHDGSRVFVDARPAEEYLRAHLPGAISLPFQTLDAQSASAVLASPGPLVIYCSGPECDDSLLLAMDLRKLGRTDLSVFIGGMELWQSELLRTEGEVSDEE